MTDARMIAIDSLIADAALLERKDFVQIYGGTGYLALKREHLDEADWHDLSQTQAMMEDRDVERARSVFERGGGEPGVVLAKIAPDMIGPRQAFTIGRNAGSSLRLNDSSVSAQHARLWLRHEEKSICLGNLGAANGTLVDGVTLTRGTHYVVAHGARVILGAVLSRFLWGDNLLEWLESPRELEQAKRAPPRSTMAP